MEPNKTIQNVASTKVMGNNNTVHNTVNVTLNLESRGGTRHTDSTQTNSASGGASSCNNSTQTNRASGSASHPRGSYSVNNIAESITDEAKRNAEVKEIEITWLAKQVSRNGLFCSKKDSLYRHLNIPDQECVRIKQERLVGNRNIEDEIFKVVHHGWLQAPPTKTRIRLIKQLFSFKETLAKIYAEYINSCDNFDIGLPLPLLPPPGTMTTCSSLSALPSIQGLLSLPSLLSPTEIPALTFNSLSIEGNSSAEGSQLVPASTLPNHQGSSSVDGGEVTQSGTFPIHLRADVNENEISWLSEKVANGRHSSERNSLYRHLSIPDSEVERIKYEKLGEDRNIENEIFKVVLHGWYLQGLSRMRALFCWQLLTFNRSLAEDYMKFVNENVSSGQ